MPARLASSRARSRSARVTGRPARRTGSRIESSTVRYSSSLVLLEHQPDRVQSGASALELAPAREVRPVEANRTARGTLDAAGEVQEGRLAASTASDQRDPLPGPPPRKPGSSSWKVVPR